MHTHSLHIGYSTVWTRHSDQGMVVLYCETGNLQLKHVCKEVVDIILLYII